MASAAAPNPVAGRPHAAGGAARRVAVTGVVFALCCVVDLLVLRPVWLDRQVTEGQFRRGYFERFGSVIGLAVDGAVRPQVIPSFLATDDGELAVPPGMIAVAPLSTGATYELRPGADLAPYLVIGEEAPLPGQTDDARPAPGEARLVAPRALALRDGNLALIAWDPTRPWRDDAARLSALHAGCAARDGGTPLIVTNYADRLEIRYGRCTLAETPTSAAAPATSLVAVLAGPDWLLVGRRPGWVEERRIVWPVLAAVGLKVSAMCWGAGLVSAAATSALLGVASVGWPTPAILTWPLLLIVGIAAAALRALAMALRRLSPRWRLAAGLAALALAAGVVRFIGARPGFTGPNWRIHPPEQADVCAVIGYSTVEDQGLRGERGGIRWLLDAACDRCRDRTASLALGGGTLAWAGNAYCSSDPAFGANGHVVFLGGTNDDFLTGVVSLARLFVIGRQGIEPWRRSQAAAASASLRRIDAQTAALTTLVDCARARGADVLFLQDFIVSDMVAGRPAERTAMVKARRDSVEAAGGTFVDLLALFGADAGVSWFNDYIHLSTVAHERVAEHACRQIP